MNEINPVMNHTVCFKPTSNASHSSLLITISSPGLGTKPVHDRIGAVSCLHFQSSVNDHVFQLDNSYKGWMVG